VTDSSQPIAGWYPDPENSAAERWWDGTAWSDHRRASTVAPVPPAAPVAPAAPPVPAAAPAETAPAAAPPVPDANGFTAPGATLSAAAPTASATVSPYGAPAAAGAPQYAYGAPAAPAAYNPYGAPAYTPTAPANSLAVVGLVLALGGLLISFGGLTPLAGGIISTIALSRAAKMKARGETGHRWGMALAGTICGYAIFLLALAAFIFGISFLINQSATSYDDFS
jgi:hypothetical protein